MAVTCKLVSMLTLAVLCSMVIGLSDAYALGSKRGTVRSMFGLFRQRHHRQAESGRSYIHASSAAKREVDAVQPPDGGTKTKGKHIQVSGLEGSNYAWIAQSTTTTAQPAGTARIARDATTTRNDASGTTAEMDIAPVAEAEPETLQEPTGPSDIVGMPKLSDYRKMVGKARGLLDLVKTVAKRAAALTERE